MIFILLASIVIIGVVQGSPILNDVETEWMKFKEQHGKQYKSISEENERKAIFSSNYDKIAKHNALYEQGASTYFLKINERADMTMTEMRKSNGFIRSASVTDSFQKVVFKPKDGDSIPESFDWRNKGAVTAVKGQGGCASCWTFSTTGALEAQYFLKTGKLVELSNQNLLDCSRDEGNNGCHGGNMIPAFKYIHTNDGIDDDSYYPYKAVQSLCWYSATHNVTSLKAYGVIEEGKENDMKAAVAIVGPTSVAMDASQFEFSLYGGGVYYNSKCTSKLEYLNHAVLAVGYGSENGQDYWLIKNSYGVNWGLQGYMKLARNKNNHCGVATYTSYPIMY